MLILSLGLRETRGYECVAVRPREKKNHRGDQ